MSSRLTRLAAVIAGAAVIATAAAVISSAAPDKKSSKPVPADLLAGIPEKNGVLGSRDAPATLTEFVDPQCPVCAAAAREVLPTIIDDYVRTGKVKLDARVLSFLGPDSVTLARYAAGAREQNKLWPFLEQVFANQGTENTGYVNEAFVARVAKAAGVTPRTPTSAARQLDAATAEAKRLGVTGTPTFVLTQGGHSKIVDPTDLGASL